MKITVLGEKAGETLGSTWGVTLRSGSHIERIRMKPLLVVQCVLV